MVPRDMCDEAEIGFTLVEQLEFRGMDKIIKDYALTLATMLL